MKLVWFWSRNSLGGLAARVEGTTTLAHHRIELGLLLVAELTGEVVERHVEVGGRENHGGQAVSGGVETLGGRRQHWFQARRHQELTHLEGLLLQRFEAR